jgi:hypothetical protein
MRPRGESSDSRAIDRKLALRVEVANGVRPPADAACRVAENVNDQ